jgi:hypothetical protein
MASTWCKNDITQSALINLFLRQKSIYCNEIEKRDAKTKWKTSHELQHFDFFSASLWAWISATT